MSSGSSTVNSREISDEMALIAEADFRHHLLHVQVRVFNQVFRMLHSNRPQVLTRRCAHLIAKKMSQTRRRDVHRFCERVEPQVLLGRRFDTVDYLKYP